MKNWFSEQAVKFGGFLDAQTVILLVAIILLALSLSGVMLVDWITSRNIPWPQK